MSASDKIDFVQKFYVRLEDNYQGVWQLDVTPVDGYALDSTLTLQERLIQSNNRRLLGLE